MKKKSSKGSGLKSCVETPFAITSTGDFLVNAIGFDGVKTTEDALQRALREPSRVFIGIVLEPEEITLVLRHLGDLVHEPAGFVIGGRQRRAKLRR